VRCEARLRVNRSDHNGFVRATLRAWRPLVGVLVLFLAADESRIGFNIALERRVERIGTGGMTKAMEHEPCRFLRDFQVLSELRGGNALLVAGDHPNGDEPLTQGELRVLENRANLNGEALAALAALVGA